jgi:hypothetical protein
METNEMMRSMHTTPLLTQEQLQTAIYYDADTGSFERNEGILAGKLVKIQTQTPKKLRKQNTGTLKVRAKNYKLTAPTGYNIITERRYTDVIASGEPAFKRYYATRNPDLTSIYATVIHTYYLLPVPASKGYPMVTILGKKYPAQQIAYLWMGAGGDWDYSQGLDNVQRIPEHITSAPHGLKYYCPITNKPKRVPCRDGNKLNLTWDNIKPNIIPSSQIAKDPTTVKKKKPKRTLRRAYSYALNIVGSDGAYTLRFMGSKPFYAWTWEQACAEFDKRLSEMRGVKQMLRDGKVLVSSHKVDLTRSVKKRIIDLEVE